MAPKFGLGDVQEARFATRALSCEQLGVLHLRMKPNQTGPFAHRHVEQEEVYVVLEGSAQILLDEEVRDITKGDLLRIGPAVSRALRTGDDGVTLLCIGAPAVSGGSNDAELVGEADWPS